MSLKVAIIGRPNVGKSTLFNRLAGRKVAIVHDQPGVTRDRRETPAKLRDMNLVIIDTAGYEYSKEDNIEKRMWEQTKRAINDADVCLFLFDSRDGLQPYDEHFAQLLRQMQKPVILLANKCEGKLQEDSIGEAYKLGFGQPIPFSAEHGLGMADLYDALHEYYLKLGKNNEKSSSDNMPADDNGTEEISEEAYGEQGDASQLVDAAEQRIFSLAQNREMREFRHIRDIMANVYIDLENLAGNPEHPDHGRRPVGRLDERSLDHHLAGQRPRLGRLPDHHRLGPAQRTPPGHGAHPEPEQLGGAPRHLHLAAGFRLRHYA